MVNELQTANHQSDPPPVTPRLWIHQVTFSDGSALSLGKSDVVVLVGPNNAGKSATLRSIRDKLAASANSEVITGLEATREGTAGDVLEWIKSFAKVADPMASTPQYQAFGQSLHASHIAHYWDAPPQGMHALSRFFCHMLTADERLAASNPAQNIDYSHDAPSHPLHYLFRDDRLEQRLSTQFRKAFGTDLVVNRLSGARILLHVGQRPTAVQGEDRLSYEYVQRFEKLPQLQTQGDGMRSFAGVLLYTSVGRESIVLVDEPEAFLHPPQARELGRMLVTEKAGARQLFIATHSGDVLRGMLNAGSAAVRVVRMRREGDINRISQLDNSKIVELWGDPLLRHSNILDGLFHEKVVVCESDSDARFYSAVADAVVEKRGPDASRPDVMFTHCGGKDRLAVVLRALRGVAVPVATAVDFDVLSAEQPLRNIVEAAGGNWSQVEKDWSIVKSAIESKKPELNASEVKKDIGAVLEQITETNFPKEAKERIQKIFRRSSPWATAKEGGKSFVPAGEPTQAYGRLIAELSALGICVVEVGELEGFVKSVGNHGPKWVNEVLKKDLGADVELEEARRFVSSLLAT